MEQQTQKYLKKFNKIYPWYYSISSDLTLYIAIDTLFLTVVKNLDASQIVFLTSISLAITILLQPIILRIMKKLGNTTSVRLGSIMALISIIAIAFIQPYVLLILAQTIRSIGNAFRNMGSIILSENLKAQDKQDHYVKIMSKANFGYAIITMIGALIAGFLFDVSPYIPMVISIFLAGVSVVLSFQIKEVRTKQEETIKQEAGKTKKVRLTVTSFIVVLAYALFMGLIVTGQQNGKLFIQYELTNAYGISMVASYLGMIVFVSRVIRVATNMFFDKAYSKYQDKVIVGFSILLFLSFVLLIAGNAIAFAPWLKFGIMSIGFCIVLGIRDLFQTCIENWVLKNTRQIEHQTIFSYLNAGKDAGAVVLGLLSSALLMHIPMVWIIALFAVLALIEIRLVMKLYYYSRFYKPLQEENS